MPGSPTSDSPASLRVLICNWRDIRHPRAGGAERVTYEMARRWVEWGHQVTWFAASFPGAQPRETIDGIEIWRAGSQATVHWQAFLHYQRHFKGRFDVIVDEINTIPFFTPLYAREPVVLYLNQLARNVWFYEAQLPLACLGYLAEPVYLQPYRRCSLLTISESTRQDAARMGLRGSATLIPMATDLPPVETLPDLVEKEAIPTLIYVGRVVPSKRVDEMIRMLGRLHCGRGVPAQLWIVGSGTPKYQASLRALADEEGVTDSVRFWGRVSLEEKRGLLQRAHVNLMASVREGWGLTVTEAARVGTPSAVYNVHGLRDSTRHDETGLVCTENTPENLAGNVARMLLDTNLYARLREVAWQDAASLQWEDTARSGLRALQEAVVGERQARRDSA